MQNFKDYVNEKKFYGEYGLTLTIFDEEGNEEIDTINMEIDTDYDEVKDSALSDMKFSSEEEYDDQELEDFVAITIEDYKVNSKDSKKWKELCKQKNFKKEFESFLYKERDWGDFKGLTTIEFTVVPFKNTWEFDTV